MTDEECGSLDCYRELRDGTVTSKWKLSWYERIKILITGILWLDTRGIPPQPIAPYVDSLFPPTIPLKIKIWWFIKCLINFGSIKDGSICWFSDKFWDIHDYPISKGGDGAPAHMCTYVCSRCNKIFSL